MKVDSLSNYILVIHIYIYIYIYIHVLIYISFICMKPFKSLNLSHFSLSGPLSTRHKVLRLILKAVELNKKVVELFS